MNWSRHHDESERLAQQAHFSLRAGDLVQAGRCFEQAAIEEEKALGYLSPEKPRTYGITAVSVVSLMLKSGALETAERLAHKVSAPDYLPPFARDQIRTILQTIWNKQAQKEAGITFAPNQLLVSVKGGEVVRGGAPLELIVEKVQEVSSLIYRTVEYLSKKPLRKRGRAPRDIQDRCTPWLFQSVPGSYQFIVAIQSKPQFEMFDDDFAPEEISRKLIDILKSASESSESAIKEIVAEEDYRSTFLKMARNLAPTGKSFSQIEIGSAVEAYPSVILSNLSRRQISDMLNPPVAAEVPSVLASETLEIRGVLRALNLDRDIIEIHSENMNYVITETGDVVDDVIGPMVNHNVIVRARGGQKSGKLVFIDIERDA